MIVLVILTLPYLQSKLHFIKEKPLKGYSIHAIADTLSMIKWFSGDYQEQEEKFLNESFGFRSAFIRINNQIAFSLFNKAKAQGIIIGKDNYLFEENYIKAYYGIDFIGTDKIRNRIQKLQRLQDTLLSMNKSLITVFAAGKGSYYPEFFPDEFITAKDTTNYEIYIKLAKKYDLNFIDFNQYFLDKKRSSIYPLYPQFGIHWSKYGQCLAADSLIKFIERNREIDMPNIYWKQIKLSAPQKEDMDIADGMNLIFYPKTFKMAYPEIRYQSDSNKVKPSLLVIADSYYWGMYNFGISNIFSESHFWFYNQQIFPESFQSPLSVNQVNLKEQIEQHDVIILLATEATLPQFGWGFIENAFDLYKQ